MDSNLNQLMQSMFLNLQQLISNYQCSGGWFVNTMDFPMKLFTAALDL